MAAKRLLYSHWTVCFDAHYPAQDKTTTRPVYTQNYFTKKNKQKNVFYLSKTKESIRVLYSDNVTIVKHKYKP